jgi:hypothetical protein
MNKNKKITIVLILILSAAPVLIAQRDVFLEMDVDKLKKQVRDLQSPPDFSTDVGRKAYLLDHPSTPYRYKGTDASNTLQRDADDLAEKAGYTSATINQKEDIISLILKGNPSINKQELKIMSSTDIRKLIYNSYRSQGKSMSEARDLADKMALPHF